MILQTGILRKYRRIMLSQCGVDNEYEKSIYLSFSTSRAYIISRLNIMRVSLPFSIDTGESVHPDFYVDAEYFLQLCSYYDVLKLENYEFSTDTGSDVFKIKHVKDINPSLPSFDIDQEKVTTFEYTEEIDSLFTKALGYMADPKCVQLMGMFIFDDTLVASDRFKTIIGKLPIQVGEIKFMADPAKIITRSEIGDMVSLSTLSNSRYYVKLGDDFEMLIPFKGDLSMVDVRDPRFVAIYNHPTYLVVQKDDLDAVLCFLDPFAKDAPSQRAEFSVENGMLTVRVKDINKISKSLKATEVQGVEGQTFWASIPMFKMLERHIEDEKIKIQFGSSSVGVTLSGVTNKNITTICSKINKEA